MAILSYEDVTYALDAAGTETVSLPSNDATRLVVLATIDGREHACQVREVRCSRADDNSLVVELLAE